MSYTIEPKCPHCGAVVKINVHKVDRMEARIKCLENENAELKRKIKLLEMMRGPGANPYDAFSELFK